MASPAEDHENHTASAEEGDDQYESTSQASAAEVLDSDKDDKEQEQEQQGDGVEAEKIDSRHSANSISSVPNGGLTAWLQVLGAWCLFFNTWGLLNTFGIYQTYYESGELFHASSSDLSWIGAIQACLLLLVGAVTGPVYDAGHFRFLLLSGSFLVVFGHMMLSLVHTYWQALLAQGFVIGIGAGFLFVPSVAIISTYFTTHLSTAIGIAASGSSLGGVIYPIMFYKLQPQVGFGWATRIIGFMALGMLIIPVTVMRMRVKPAAKRALFNVSAFKEMPYTVYVLGSAIGFMGLYIPFFYLSYFSFASGITNMKLGFYMLPILNAASTFGRIIPNIIADKTGPLNMLVPSSLMTAILIYVLLRVDNLGGVVTIAVLYGFFSGTFVSLPPSVFVRLTPPEKRSQLGTRIGQGFTVTAFGVLAGTPIAGAILGSNNYFAGIWIFGGSLTAAGTAMFALARFIATKGELKVKI